MVKFFFLVATIAMITEKLPFPISITTIVRETNSFIKIMRLINYLTYWLAYQSKLSLKKWNQTDKGLWRRKVVIKVYPLPHYSDAGPSNRVKTHWKKFFFLIFTTILTVSHDFLFFLISFMASLNILCLGPHNFFLKKQERETWKNFLWSIKNFQKYFMTHQFIPKKIHCHYKDPLAPILNT